MLINFCPNCGKKLPNTPHNQMPYGTHQDGAFIIHEELTGFDCHCDACEWSGSIEPDYLFRDRGE
mgnify:CR=1 FL=1